MRDVRSGYRGKHAGGRRAGPERLGAYVHRHAMSDSRLRRSADIRAALGARSRAHGRAVVVHARRRDDDRPARWTVIAGRRVGSAVRRNRAKRRLRAVLRRRSLPAGTDLVVVARARAVDAAPDALERELEVLIDTAARPAPGVPR